MSTKIDLDELVNFIGEAWPYDSKSYPGFDDLTDVNKMLFIVKHSILHMNKSLGKIAAEAEAADHGETLNVQQVRIATVKLMVNTLKLAHALHMSAEKLDDIAFSIVRSSNR